MSKDEEIITVVVADDHPVVLEGIVGVISLESELRVVAKCATGTDALRAIEELRPTVALLDITMPGMDGVKLLSTLQANGSATKVILLTANLTDQQLLKAIEHSAAALLLKDEPISSLKEIVKRVVRGERFFPQGLVDAALEHTTDSRNMARRLDALSARERQVARLVATGQANKEIARELDLSDGTVRIHLHSIFQKLNVSSRSALTAFILRYEQSQTGS